MRKMRLKEDEKLLFTLRGLYSEYGYRPFRMSKFETYELYAGNRDFLVCDRIITFNDTNWELLALKPDVTLSIVKNAAFRQGYKQKLYYQENVYRPSGSSRHFREILQCGLECIGDLDCYDEFEVLTLAEKSLAMISEDSVLSFSHLGILRDLVDVLGAEETQQSEMVDLIAARNTHELEELFTRCGWNREPFNDVRELLSLSCGAAELPEKLESISWISSGVLQELRQIGLLCREEKSRARFDFSVSNDLHYYNGLVFQGFVRGISEKLLSGGQYDSLLQRMNRKGSAIGFAVYFGLLEQLQCPENEFDADVLLLYDSETSLSRVRAELQAIRAEGLSVSAQRCETGMYREIRDIRGDVQNA